MLNDRWTIPLLLALIGTVFVIFGLWPWIDLAVAGRFHDASGFSISRQPIIEGARRAFWDLSIVLPVLALGILAKNRISGATLWGLPNRVLAYVFALFILAPGLLVNVILKAHWGRARPTAVTEFGGTAHFTPFYEITDQCTRNCSFVSGEGAGSMAVLISTLLILRVLRPKLSPLLYRLAVAASYAMLIFVGFQRVAAGGHFLSDLLLSWLFTLLIAAILSRLILPDEPADNAAPRPSAT